MSGVRRSKKSGAVPTAEQRLARAQRALEGAQLLAVICDRLQEISEPEVVRDVTLTTGVAFHLAGRLFEQIADLVVRQSGGFGMEEEVSMAVLARVDAARSAFTEAETYYRRARYYARASVARKRVEGADLLKSVILESSVVVKITPAPDPDPDPPKTVMFGFDPFAGSGETS